MYYYFENPPWCEWLMVFLALNGEHEHTHRHTIAWNDDPSFYTIRPNGKVSLNYSAGLNKTQTMKSNFDSCDESKRKWWKRFIFFLIFEIRSLSDMHPLLALLPPTIMARSKSISTHTRTYQQNEREKEREKEKNNNNTKRSFRRH